MTPLLEIRDLRLTAGGSVPVVDGISLRMSRGTLTGLVGESGSGKTMAARAVMRLLPPGIRQTAGQILLDGEDLSSAPAKRIRQLRGPTLGMVFQEPMVSLNPALTIGTQMAEAMRLHTRLSRLEIRERSVEMLRRVRIADPERCLSAFPHEFSGGMRQRIMLASVMLLRPKLLIADEPTTALDTLAQREVLDLMVELARDSETAVLLITHNLGLVARYTQDVVVLRNGRIMEAGPTAMVLAQPQSSYTRSLLGAVIRKPLSPQSRPKGPVLVRAEGLTVRYKGRLGLTGRRAGHAAVCDANLEIREGETVAVVGGSGSGKTTLGRALLGLLPATAGRIEYRGHDIVTADAETRRRARLDCQMVFQDPFSSLDPRQRIGDIVLEPLRHRPDLTAAERHRLAAEVLDEVGLGGLGRRYPHELSGGQRQRVAIARAVVRRPPFVVADEPISALDVTIQAQVLELFRSLQRRHGFACLFISHDLAAVQSIAHRVVVMEAGRIVEEGPIDAVFAMPRQPYTRALIEATPLLDGPRDPEGPRTIADPGACAG